MQRLHYKVNSHHYFLNIQTSDIFLSCFTGWMVSIVLSHKFRLGLKKIHFCLSIEIKLQPNWWLKCHSILQKGRNKILSWFLNIIFRGETISTWSDEIQPQRFWQIFNFSQMLFATKSDQFRLKRHKSVIISSPRIFIANCLMVTLSHDNLMMTNPTWIKKKSTISVYCVSLH